MRKITHLTSFFFLLLLLTSFNNHADKTVSLTITIDNLRNSKGIVQFALYNKNGTIPDEDFTKCYKILKANIVNKTATITFTGIPLGKYAANIFHDENNNGKIDKGFVMPIEGIGFSNYNTIGFSNRPNFAKASFDINTNKSIKIAMVYL